MPWWLPGRSVQWMLMIHQLETDIIQCALERTGGRGDAAKLLGVTFDLFAIAG